MLPLLVPSFGGCYPLSLAGSTGCAIQIHSLEREGSCPSPAIFVELLRGVRSIVGPCSYTAQKSGRNRYPLSNSLKSFSFLNGPIAKW